jgi:hypothetical protein
MDEQASESLFIRLYLDEDVHKAIPPALQARGFDVVSVHSLKHYTWSDAQHLAYAASEGRAIFTFNAPDYIALHLAYLDQGKSHAGIIVSKQHPIRETIHRLLQLLNRFTNDEMKNQLWWI